MLTVPEACDTVGALRAILKERIRDVRFCMWWESDSDEYEGNGLDDTVGILESTKPLVIAIPSFALHFQINGRDIAVKHINPEDDLSTLYSELDKSYKNFKCGELPGIGDLKFERPNIKWNNFHIYQLWNMEGWPGRSEESALVVCSGLFTWKFEEFHVQGVKNYALRGFQLRSQREEHAEKSVLEMMNYCARFDSASKGYAVLREGLTPFVVLENSSGTGKTQMAFIHDRPVLYIVCSKQDNLQAVYQPFLDIFNHIADIMDIDAKVLEKLKLKKEGDPPASSNLRPGAKRLPLQLYGFLLAYLRLLREKWADGSVCIDGVKLVDESGVFSEDICGNKISFAYSPCTIADLQEGYRNIKDPKPVIVLDEVASSRERSVFIRNVCRVARIPVILMGTDSSVVNFLVSENSDSRDGDQEYGILISRLPPLYLLQSEEEHIQLLEEPIRKLVLSSRPLCAIRMIESGMNTVDELVDVIKEKVVDLKKDKSKENSFEKGHLIYLGASAHLMHSLDASTVFLSHHFGQLKESKITIFWRGGIDVDRNDADACSKKIDENWFPETAFRCVREDFFLHVALLQYTRELFKKPFHTVAIDIHENNKIGIIGRNGEPSESEWWRLEDNTLSAACISSMSKGIAGCTLKEFLGAFLFHMNPNFNSSVSVTEVPNFPRVEINVQHFRNDFPWFKRFPLLGLPVPAIVNFWEDTDSLLGTINEDLKPVVFNLRNPIDKECHDGYAADMGGKQVMYFQCKDRRTAKAFDISKVKAVLRNIPETVKLLFGVLNGDMAQFQNLKEDLSYVTEQGVCVLATKKVTEEGSSDYCFEVLVSPAERSDIKCTAMLFFLEGLFLKEKKRKIGNNF
jgi:hypothetical protein